MYRVLLFFFNYCFLIWGKKNKSNSTKRTFCSPNFSSNKSISQWFRRDVDSKKKKRNVIRYRRRSSSRDIEKLLSFHRYFVNEWNFCVRPASFLTAPTGQNGCVHFSLSLSLSFSFFFFSFFFVSSVPSNDAGFSVGLLLRLAGAVCLFVCFVGILAFFSVFFGFFFGCRPL